MLFAVDYTADGPSQTVSRYTSRVELLCGWHGSLLQPHAVYMTRGVNKRRETQECTHVRAPLFLSFLVSPLSLLCFDKQSRGKPCRTLRHLSSEVRPGQDDYFAVTMLSQHKIGKTDSTHEKATCSAHYIPLPPIFPLLRWEDGGA